MRVLEQEDKLWIWSWLIGRRQRPVRVEIGPNGWACRPCLSYCRSRGQFEARVLISRNDGKAQVSDRGRQVGALNRDRARRLPSGGQPQSQLFANQDQRGNGPAWTRTALLLAKYGPSRRKAPRCGAARCTSWPGAHSLCKL